MSVLPGSDAGVADVSGRPVAAPVWADLLPGRTLLPDLTFPAFLSDLPVVLPCVSGVVSGALEVS